jgi:hypothetical protein
MAPQMPFEIRIDFLIYAQFLFLTKMHHRSIDGAADILKVIQTLFCLWNAIVSIR